MDFTLYNKYSTRILDWIFPASCPGCSRPRHKNESCQNSRLCEPPKPINPCNRCAIETPFAEDLCGKCLSTKTPFDKSIPAFRYEGYVRNLILKLKTSGNRYALRLLSGRLLTQIEKKGSGKVEVIIPVPMHRGNRRARGFNQATMLSRELSKKLNIPIDRNLLIKVKRTPKQSTLSLKDRKTNLKNAFQLNKSNTYKCVAIVDDVVTTTATISEIGKILKKNGVDYIEVWSIARAS